MMIDGKRYFRNVATASTVASAATSAAASACGQLERGNAVAPLNAISHIIWGEKAARQNGASWKYTATGLALNAAAITSWAGVFELLCGSSRVSAARAIGSGMAVAALAYVTDYYVVPRRLTPGFEKRLSAPSMLAVYSVLGLSIGLGGWLSRRVFERD